MKFGICTSIQNAPSVLEAGWDYLEGSVQELLQSDEPVNSPLPILAGNLLVPATMKITGPDVDARQLRSYMSAVIPRAQKIGMRTLVFGSGRARKVPDGFPRESAERQIADFGRMSADIAAKHDVTIVIEPLNRDESNIVNSLAEAMKYVNSLDHPHFQCLVDSYHFWLENEPLEHLATAAPFIRHVHVADKHGRVPPGQSGMSNYRELFGVLKRAGYDGNISVEGDFPVMVIDASGARILDYLKTQWLEA